MHTAKQIPSPVEESTKYQALFDQASDAIIALRADGAIDAANQAVEEMTGYLKSEIVSASVEILSPKTKSGSFQKHARALTAELFRFPGTYEDIAILRKDGYVRFVDLSVRMVSDASERLVLALFRDVTEKKRMERELITKHAELKNAYYQLEKKNAELESMQETLVQSGKLAALGELAAGIAHELNQPLQGIRGYAQEIQSFLGMGVEARPGAENSNPEARSALKEVISNVDKMSSIIDYLRVFTRKSVEQHESTDLHFAIEEALKMLSRQFAARGITVHREFQGEPALVYANPLQLEQVFINLATNARDAIESTGRGTGNIWIRTKALGNFVEVRFKDDGHGMNDRTKSKAFNPFFTTKEVGKGMGLGLSLSYGIISKIHGSILVESELGKGTEFLIRIPKDFRELA